MTEAERIATLEANYKTLLDDVAEIKADVRETRDAIVGAKVGGRLLLGAAAVVGGIAGYASSFLKLTGKG